MTDIHSFKNTVVAVFDSPGPAREVVERLSIDGYDFEILEGEEGSRHLDAGGEEGLWAALRRMATALGDENRVLRRLDAEIAEGNVVISVDIEESDDRESSMAVSIIREHGGKFIWKFGEWAFTPIEI